MSVNKGSGTSTPPKDFGTPTTLNNGSDMELDSPINTTQLFDNQNNEKGTIELETPNQDVARNDNLNPKPSTILYKNTDTGPFFVYIEKVSEEQSRINAIKVGDLLFKYHPELDNKIVSIENVGRNRIRVKFTDYMNANRLLRSNNLQQLHLYPYIPKFITHKYGIIRGIDYDLDEEYLKAKIKQLDMHCKFDVDTVKRIHRKGTLEDGTKKLYPTKTVIVSFKSNVLPKYIAINHVRIPVEQYQQKVLLCYNCFRYGHLKKHCKSKMRCLACEGKHDIKECSKNITVKTCFYCDNEHYTNEISLCPEFTRQKTIKKIMTEQNISFWEANKMVPKITYSAVLQNRENNTNKTSNGRNDKNITNKLNLTQPEPRMSNPQKHSYDFRTNTQLRHSQNFQQSHTAHTQIEPQRKRHKPVTDNNWTRLHSKMSRQYYEPSASGGILETEKYKNNLGASREVELHQKINFESLTSIIIAVLKTINEKDIFDIQEASIVSILKGILQNQNNSDDEFF